METIDAGCYYLHFIPVPHLLTRLLTYLLTPHHIFNHTGPSGFYTAKYLTELDPSLHIDILERLPTPFGLVRFGVAPDHELTKNVMTTFHEVASRAQITYRGNV